ncbi:diaminopimelate decarboxylase [Mycobacterium sp. ACS4331]|uniref:diaminopimelate decarboxylase n=1 Tax=Mycobacterium sp. ACS4331 TaxID=1834121 RepID=UPI0007FF0A92|nr:diaminopimelate decarboxylase [Mycobacterium sp. ACS4331]OBF25017.1 diaminopimelate decarboxylase [Mycobacterium sp. ACS4331]
MTLLDFLPSLQHAATTRIDPTVWPLTTQTDDLGRLTVGGVALTNLANQYGTPAYVLDEKDFRRRIRDYRALVPNAAIVYAGKSLLTPTIASWAAEEQVGIDVCSEGELAAALHGGFDPARIVLHGNAKPPSLLRQATAAHVGRIVIDSPIEIAFLACETPRPQPVLIRVTPDIDIHGHASVTTGVTDQKFGFALADGHAEQAVARIIKQPQLILAGVHCHLGSQIADPDLYREAVGRLIAFMADVRSRYGITLNELNLGGGHAIAYRSGDPTLHLAELSATVDDALEQACISERFPKPRIVIEPGRAISGHAGVTLYRVVAVKTQPGGRTFVAVDGGMSDHPRTQLYGAKYTVALANRHPIGATMRVTVAGRHCESGDEIARDVELPADTHPGDLLAVACTGAYHHAMASNYNMVGRPPLIGVHHGDATEIIRRETVEDLLARDVAWQKKRRSFDALLHGE